MKLTLILLLFLWDNVEFTLTHEATFCEKPLIYNGTVQGDKEKYDQHEVLSYSCAPGYTKVDSEPSVCLKADSAAAAQWSPMPRCEEITCKLSSDPPEGTTYSPQNQTTFRPGQTVTVSCGDKHWVKSRELQSADLRCQDTGGWDYEPVCKPIMCQPVTLTANNRVLVNGDMEQPQSGSVLQFRCTSPDDVLEGPTQILCDEYGNWDGNPPRCGGLTCLKPESPIFEVHGDKLVYRKDEVLRYSCIPRYKKRDGRPSVCRKVGQSAEWAPMPHCEPIKCKLSANPPAGTEYSPRNQIIFDPGQRVRVTCGDKYYVKSRELQSAELRCQDTGLWDYEPVCHNVELAPSPLQ